MINNYQKIETQTINLYNDINIDILRLDKIHDIVSGNKYFKLKYFIQDAINKKYSKILTFGGGFSNHIIATAYYSNLYNLNSLGIIKGDYSKKITNTLQNCLKFKMKLEYVNKEIYNYLKHQNNTTKNTQHYNEYYFIPEGGYGYLGAKGIEELFLSLNLDNYTHIITSVGTGTTIAGIINAIKNNKQQIIGIVPMKNNLSLKQEIIDLLQPNKFNFSLLHDYHFGGFGKISNEILELIQKFNTKYNLPLDKIYTAKTMYACLDLINKKQILKTDKIIFIHTGGLQGN